MQREDFGKKLLLLRKNKQVSQAEVATYIGLTVAAYQNYENGRREAGYETIAKLADFYGVTTDYLLGRGEPAEPPNPIDQLAISDADKLIVQAYINLQPKERTTFVEIIKKIAAGADVDIVTSNGIEQETYPVQTAARRGVNGEHSPITTEYLAAAEIEDIINAEDGDDDL